MNNSVHAARRSDNSAGFQHHWLAESIRLRESQWGPLQDSQETRQARASGQDLTQRLLLRAQYLGQREGIDATIRQWLSGAKLAFVVLLILAILTGAAAVLGALGDGTRQVNLVLALVALLGLHALTFLFWALSSIFPSGSARTGLGDLWLWLTRKLARGPQAALVPQALASLLARHAALRPLLGAVSHALWTSALTSILITLVALLSARRYAFSWETTLLSPDTFVRLTESLGWLPSKLGFSIPPETIIRASDGLQVLPASAHAQWSGWLIGCVVCYGLLPRLLALIVTTTLTRRRVRRIRLDTRLPGYIELQDRLEPLSEPGGIDAPAPADAGTPASSHRIMDAGSPQMIVGLELPPDDLWPPAPLAPHIGDLGVVDDRAQRQRVLNTLQTAPPQHLLIVCDGNQTPDRGTIALIHELHSLTAQTRVLILATSGIAAHETDPRADSDTVALTPDVHSSSGPGTPTSTRSDLWNEQLQRAGLPADGIFVDLNDAMAWLENKVS